MMIKNWTLTLLIGMLIINISCDDKDDSAETPQAIVKGECTFYNVFEGVEQKNEAIKTSIESLGSATLPSGMPQTISGSEFQFGPLNEGDYLLTAILEDVDNNIVYSVSDTVKIISKTDFINRDLVLIPSSKTQFLRGRIQFADILTNNIVDVESLDVSKIKRIDAFVKLVNDGASSLPAPEYMFGPLVPGSYLLSFQYTDSYGLLHELNDTVTIGETPDAGLRDYVLEMSNKRQFVRGHIQYQDILTGQLIDALSFETCEIKAASAYFTAPNNGGSLLEAPNYLFGPLGNVNYIMSFSYKDEYGFVHSTVDTLVANSAEILKERNYTLKVEPNTSIIAQVVDSKGNGVGKVNVYLYNNYSFLEKYRASTDAAIAYGASDENGYVVFPDLNVSSYYLYGERIIAEDTLTTYDPNFDPTSVDALMKDSITNIQIQLN